MALLSTYVVEFSAVVEFSTCGVDFSMTVGIFSICCGVLYSCGQLHMVWDDQSVIFCRYWNALCVQVKNL